ncbi:MAG: hypothetical protein ACYCOU_04280, partial [Sulfobacillus sp.]
MSNIPAVSAAEAFSTCNQIRTVPYSQRSPTQNQQWTTLGCGTRSPYVTYAQKPQPPPAKKPKPSESAAEKIDRCQRSIDVLQNLVSTNQTMQQQYSQNLQMYNQILPIWQSAKQEQDSILTNSKYAGPNSVWLNDGSKVDCGTLNVACAGWGANPMGCGTAIWAAYCPVSPEANQKCTACSPKEPSILPWTWSNQPFGNKCYCGGGAAASGWCTEPCSNFQYRANPPEAVTLAYQQWLQDNPEPQPPSVPSYLTPFDIMCQECSANVNLSNLSTNGAPINVSGIKQAINCVQQMKNSIGSAAAAVPPSGNASPKSLTLAQLQTMWKAAGCTSQLSEGQQETWWRGLSTVADVTKDMDTYGKLAAHCSGTRSQNDFCRPGKCMPPPPPPPPPPSPSPVVPKPAPVPSPSPSPSPVVPKPAPVPTPSPTPT